MSTNRRDEDYVTAPMSVRLGTGQRQRVRELAKQEGTSQARIVGRLVEAGLTREKDINEIVRIRLQTLQEDDS